MNADNDCCDNRDPQYQAMARQQGRAKRDQAKFYPEDNST
jgi:hypothetical protein